MVRGNVVDVDRLDADLSCGDVIIRSRFTALAPVFEGTLRGDARCPPLRQHRCRKVAKERDPQRSGAQPREEPSDPGRRTECTERGGRSDDDAPAARSKSVCGLGIMGDASECAHGDPVPLDALGLIVVVTAQPHGDQNRGPEGHDRHIDQTRHINERYVDSSPEWWISTLDRWRVAERCSTGRGADQLRESMREDLHRARTPSGTSSAHSAKVR